ncbi:hypothetical protein PFISCL1PPCAC_16937, partial [Pristionchus fissidentatus]
KLWMARINCFAGSLFLLVSVLVTLLIVFDRDPRGQEYRKHLLALQCSSIVADIFFAIYDPIMQFNCPLFFSNSTLGGIIDTPLFFAADLFLITLVAHAYFSCVYYRR